MESEGKTLITFYSSNGKTSYSQTCEGVSNAELLKLCSMMEIAKMDILNDIRLKYGEFDDEEK